MVFITKQYSIVSFNETYNVEIKYDLCKLDTTLVNNFKYLCDNTGYCEIHLGNYYYYCNIILNSNKSQATIKSLKYNNFIDIKSELIKDISDIKNVLNVTMNLTMAMFPKINLFTLSDNSLKSTYQSSRSNRQIFKTVDFPQPECPIIETNSPSFISK